MFKVLWCIFGDAIFVVGTVELIRTTKIYFVNHDFYIGFYSFNFDSGADVPGHR